MFIVGEYRTRDRTATLARLNPLEADARGSYQVKVIEFHRFRTVDDARKYARTIGICFDLDDKKTK